MSALNSKFDEIAAYLARKLGHGEWANLSAEDQAKMRDEAEDAVDAWLEAENEDIKPLKRDSELRRLLGEYEDIAETILDERDARLTDDDKDQGLGDDT